MRSTAKIDSPSHRYSYGIEGTDPASSMLAERQGINQGWDWRQHLRTLVPIVGIFVVLAFYGIDRQSMWEDEYNSLWRVTASKYPVWKDGHGFLYFALLNLWIQFGTSELVLRSLSVLLGALAVCLTYALGIELLGSAGRNIWDGGFLRPRPFFIWYSQEARYVTLVLAATLLSMYAFHRVISRPTFAWWFAYGAATLLAFFSFLSMVLLAVVQGLYLLGSPRRFLLRRWLVCQVLVFALFGWWFVKGTHFLPALMEARGRGQQVIANPDVFPFTGEFNEVRLAVLPYTFFAFSSGFSLGPSARETLCRSDSRPIGALRSYACYAWDFFMAG